MDIIFKQCIRFTKSRMTIEYLILFLNLPKIFSIKLMDWSENLHWLSYIRHWFHRTLKEANDFVHTSIETSWKLVYNAIACRNVAIILCTPLLLKINWLPNQRISQSSLHPISNSMICNEPRESLHLTFINDDLKWPELSAENSNVQAISREPQSTDDNTTLVFTVDQGYR